jgi:hypothetical protein
VIGEKVDNADGVSLLVGVTLVVGCIGAFCFNHSVTITIIRESHSTRTCGNCNRFVVFIPDDTASFLS